MTTEKIILQVTPREAGGKIKNARIKGLMPGVLYGNGKASVSMFMDVVEFQKVYKNAGQSSIVTLSGDNISAKVLIHQVTRNTISKLPEHVDFMIVDMSHTMHAEVPLEFIGEAPAIKNYKATLVKNIYQVEVEAMADNLPHSIDVDLSHLTELDSHITLADLKLPKGVNVNGKLDTIVVSLAAENKGQESEIQVVAEAKIA